MKTTWPERAFTIRSGDGPPRTIIVEGRDRWALEALMQAGGKGITPIDNPAPRIAAYVHNLRNAGVAIETLHEPHGGPFAGTHGRYVLRCAVSVGREGGAQ